MGTPGAGRDDGEPPAVGPPTSSLKELAFLFLRLGATSSGGPAAPMALMEHEVVLRRGWLTRLRFLDLLGATNLIPRLRRSSTAGAFLEGVNAASVPLVAVVTLDLGRAALFDLPTISLSLASDLALTRHHINSAWLVLSCGLIALLLSIPGPL